MPTNDTSKQLCGASMVPGFANIFCVLQIFHLLNLGITSFDLDIPAILHFMEEIEVQRGEASYPAS